MVTDLKEIVLAVIGQALRSGGKKYVSISNRDASESKSRTLCSRTV